ncbi:outer membrane protein [candidate division CSSED10-310 bacterium]|uniref:Outer membrane protein n=1 Tax=candidate division CSSED10-310 bacterium TaxID=2855610 RepID=A0ABV6Z5A2_UNCC1
MKIFTCMSVGLLIIIMGVSGAEAYELGQMGAGGYGGVAIPFGWLGDRLNPGFTVGGQFLYSLEDLIPNLVTRLNFNFMSFSGDTYHTYYKYHFSDFSVYANGLYYFDLSSSFKPYAMAGFGFDIVHIEWDYKGYDHYDDHDTDVGRGFMAGGGIEFKPSETIGVFSELYFHTSTYAAGAGFGDFVVKLVVGFSYYFNVN